MLTPVADIRRRSRAPPPREPRYLWPRDDPPAGSTACSPSAASPARARAPPTRCAPAACGSGAAARWPTKPSQLVAEDAELLVEQPPPYVSRGGVKLANALAALGRRRRGPRLPRRRRVHRRLHRLPAPARRRAGDRARRRPRPARLGAAKRPARPRDRARQRPRADARRAPFAPALATIDVSFISLALVLPAGRALPRGRAPTCWRSSSRSSSSAASGSARAGVVRSAARPPRGRCSSAAAAAAERSGLACAASRPRGCPGRRATARRFMWCATQGPAVDVEAAALRGRADEHGGRAGARSRLQGVRTAVLMTHSIPETEGLRAAVRIAAASGAAMLVATPDEAAKHGDAAPASRSSRSSPRTPDLCLVLGGDGTILRSLRHFADTPVPVFAVNFGRIGFLAAVERDQLEHGLERAFSGDFETVTLPGLEIERGARARRSTTSPSRASPRARSPSWPTASAARRSATSAATGSSPPPRRAPPATTSPTRARSSPGASRGSPSASSRRTRSPRGRWSSPPTTCSRSRNAGQRELGRHRVRRPPRARARRWARRSRSASATASPGSRSSRARTSTSACARSSASSPAEAGLPAAA